MSPLTDTPTLEQVIYPESDGKPLGETDAHRREILEIIAMLQDHFAHHPDIYISGNLMLYYEQGNPRAVVSPDVFVVKDVSNHERPTYKLWEERQPPTVVFEITSPSTRLEDKGYKRELFAMLGVREYFLFDPLAEYLKPPLQGFRLDAGELLPIASDTDSSLVSQELGLCLRHEGSYLRLYDLATLQPLLRPSELQAAHRSEAAARRAAEERASAAEEELARLRAELARLRGEDRDA